MNELSGRELHFSTVQDKGEALVMARHPASKTIEVRMINHAELFLCIFHSFEAGIASAISSFK